MKQAFNNFLYQIHLLHAHSVKYFHLNNSGCYSRCWCYWKLLQVELEVQGGRSSEMLVDLVGMVFLWQFWNNSCRRVCTKLIIEIPCLVLKFWPGSSLVLVYSLLVFKYWSKHCWNIFFCIPLLNYLIILCCSQRGGRLSSIWWIIRVLPVVCWWQCGSSSKTQ